MLLAIVFWLNPHLQAHPMQLFMYIAAAESISTFVSFMSYQVCGLKLYVLYAKTIYFSDTLKDQVKALFAIS